MASAADSALRMQAFEVARENMEAILSKDSVVEMVEYGNSDMYPETQWQTTVETFYEPITARMWIRAICSAEYIDTADEVQTVELTHWLTDLTKEQLLQIIEEKQREKAEQSEEEPEEPEQPEEPNEPEPEPEVGCDALPYCEMVKCHLEAGTIDKLTDEELLRYIGECLD